MGWSAGWWAARSARPAPAPCDGRARPELREVAGPVRPRSVSFTLKAGEIPGRRADGGPTETVRACRPGSAGPGHGPGGPDDAPRRRSARAGWTPENRKEEGLMLGRSVVDNHPHAPAPVHPRGLFGGRPADATRRWMQQPTRATGPTQPVPNCPAQPAVALSRLLHHEAKILLLMNPPAASTPKQGADLPVDQNWPRREGHVFTSLPELLGVCDTIGVCRGGLRGPPGLRVGRNIASPPPSARLNLWKPTPLSRRRRWLTASACSSSRLRHRVVRGVARWKDPRAPPTIWRAFLSAKNLVTILTQPSSSPPGRSA